MRSGDIVEITMIAGRAMTACNHVGRATTQELDEIDEVLAALLGLPGGRPSSLATSG